MPSYGFYISNFIGMYIKRASSSDHPGVLHDVLIMLLKDVTNVVTAVTGLCSRVAM